MAAGAFVTDWSGILFIILIRCMFVCTYVCECVRMCDTLFCWHLWDLSHHLCTWDDEDCKKYVSCKHLNIYTYICAYVHDRCMHIYCIDILIRMHSIHLGILISILIWVYQCKHNVLLLSLLLLLFLFFIVNTNIFTY